MPYPPACHLHNHARPNISRGATTGLYNLVRLRFKTSYRVTWMAYGCITTDTSRIYQQTHYPCLATARLYLLSLLLRLCALLNARASQPAHADINDA